MKATAFKVGERVELAPNCSPPFRLRSRCGKVTKAFQENGITWYEVHLNHTTGPMRFKETELLQEG